MDFLATRRQKTLRTPSGKKSASFVPLQQWWKVRFRFVMFVCAHVRQVIIPFTLRLLLENTHLWLVLLHVCSTMWGMSLQSIVEKNSRNIPKKSTWKCARPLNITFFPIHGTENRRLFKWNSLSLTSSVYPFTVYIFGVNLFSIMFVLLCNA